MAEEKEMTQESMEANDQGAIYEALAKIPGAPTKEVIDEWKKAYGNVYVMPLDVNEIYVWKTLRRKEHIEIETAAAQAQAEGKQFDRDAEVVKKCVIWPKFTDESILEGKAGTIPTLLESIYAASHFIPTQLALRMVVAM